MPYKYKYILYVARIFAMIWTSLYHSRNHQTSKEMICEGQEQRTCKYNSYQLCLSRLYNKVLPNNTRFI